MSGRENVSLTEARLGDLLNRADRGSVGVYGFLTPAERKQAERWLRMRGATERAWFWGGYPDAERVCLFLLPDYLAAMLPENAENITEETMAPLLDDALPNAVSAVIIRGSGYRILTHRDYLGSLLALGLERDAVGDIAVQNQHEAVVFCAARLVTFLREGLTKVASDTVHCAAYTPDEHFTDGRVYQAISQTVASPRLDCVVAALTDLSRENAQNAVRTGLVEVDFEAEERTDVLLEPPVTVSVRGYGRFILRAFDGETRKGRLRLRADRLV